MSSTPTKRKSPKKKTDSSKKSSSPKKLDKSNKTTIVNKINNNNESESEPKKSSGIRVEEYFEAARWAGFVLDLEAIATEFNLILFWDYKHFLEISEWKNISYLHHCGFYPSQTLGADRKLNTRAFEGIEHLLLDTAKTIWLEPLNLEREKLSDLKRNVAGLYLLYYLWTTQEQNDDTKILISFTPTDRQNLIEFNRKLQSQMHKIPNWPLVRKCIAFILESFKGRQAFRFDFTSDEVTLNRESLKLVQLKNSDIRKSLISVNSTYRYESMLLWLESLCRKMSSILSEAEKCSQLPIAMSLLFRNLLPENVIQHCLRFDSQTFEPVSLILPNNYLQIAEKVVNYVKKCFSLIERPFLTMDALLQTHGVPSQIRDHARSREMARRTKHLSTQRSYAKNVNAFNKKCEEVQRPDKMITGLGKSYREMDSDAWDFIHQRWNVKRPNAMQKQEERQQKMQRFRLNFTENPIILKSSSEVGQNKKFNFSIVPLSKQREILAKKKQEQQKLLQEFNQVEVEEVEASCSNSLPSSSFSNIEQQSSGFTKDKTTMISSQQVVNNYTNEIVETTNNTVIHKATCSSDCKPNNWEFKPRAYTRTPVVVLPSLHTRNFSRLKTISNAPEPIVSVMKKSEKPRKIDLSPKKITSSRAQRRKESALPTTPNQGIEIAELEPERETELTIDTQPNTPSIQSIKEEVGSVISSHYYDDDDETIGSQMTMTSNHSESHQSLPIETPEKKRKVRSRKKGVGDIKTMEDIQKKIQMSETSLRNTMEFGKLVSSLYSNNNSCPDVVPVEGKRRKLGESSKSSSSISQVSTDFLNIDNETALVRDYIRKNMSKSSSSTSKPRASSKKSSKKTLDEFSLLDPFSLGDVELPQDDWLDSLDLSDTPSEINNESASTFASDNTTMTTSTTTVTPSSSSLFDLDEDEKLIQSQIKTFGPLFARESTQTLKKLYGLNAKRQESENSKK